jgi:PhzF family phenazine biosynthesis protein
MSRTFRASFATAATSPNFSDTHERAVLRYAAFTDTAHGGNPAGIVLDAAGLSAEQMLAIAAQVGYSETAFLTARSAGSAEREYDVRYFSPEVEVPFCGHATIAAGVALAERIGTGELLFHIAAGEVPIKTTRNEAGDVVATLRSVAPAIHSLEPFDLELALSALGWARAELEPTLPPRIAYAGARHLILAAATRQRLADLDYDFAALKDYMLERDLLSVDLVWRESERVYHARNPFPVGGVVEDPATGSAAAAFGAYLRDLELVTPPVTLTIQQGHDLGRPSQLLVRIERDQPEIEVSGRAVAIAPTPAPGRGRVGSRQLE